MAGATEPRGEGEDAETGRDGHNHTGNRGARLMRATIIYGAGDVRVQDVPDASMQASTDALVRITRSCVCGSDLWPYKNMEPSETGRRMGHEFIGVVEEIGSEVATLKRGDVVIAPFVISDGTCEFCAQGLHTSCRQRLDWGTSSADAGQGEAVRVPFADGTLVAVDVAEDDALMPSLLTLSDVFCTGHHAAVHGRVTRGDTVAVIGDGAVGLCAVLAAKRLGAERILILGRHRDRTDLAVEFGATDVVAQRGEEAVQQVRELTGDGPSSVLECVGLEESFVTALEIARPGGTVSRAGVPQFPAVPQARTSWVKNVALAGGITPARAYIEELLPDVLEGRVQPGRVFDRTIGLEDVPEGYRLMNDRESIKVMVRN
jgi:threonine dehydrogenase-like Zn-dependent dehydrogenase